MGIANWKITSLLYGTLVQPKGDFSPGFDDALVWTVPYLGYLLQNGKQNVLVDNGIHDRYIVDGKAFHDYPATGGAQFVIDALKKEGLKTSDIDAVIYTHLHNDHAGNPSLFPNAKHYTQKRELENLYFPLPIQDSGEYDPATKEDMKKLDLFIADGDLRLANGLELYLVPGHTAGSQAIRVPTIEGNYIITGDIVSLSINLFPSLDKFEQLDGTFSDVTPMQKKYHFHSLIRDVYAGTDSMDKLKVLAEDFEPKWFLTGHDPWVINQHTFG